MGIEALALIVSLIALCVATLAFIGAGFAKPALATAAVLVCALLGAAYLVVLGAAGFWESSCPDCASELSRSDAVLGLAIWLGGGLAAVYAATLFGWLLGRLVAPRSDAKDERPTMRHE